MQVVSLPETSTFKVSTVGGLLEDADDDEPPPPPAVNAKVAETAQPPLLMVTLAPDEMIENKREPNPDPEDAKIPVPEKLMGPDNPDPRWRITSSPTLRDTLDGDKETFAPEHETVIVSVVTADAGAKEDEDAAISAAATK